MDLFRRYWRSKPLRSVTVAAGVMAAAGIASRVLGFVRDRILAGQFGVGDTLDIYYAAFRIPDIMFDLLVLGALSAALIPVFAGLVAKGRDSEAWRAASGVLVLLSGSLAVIAVLAWVMAPAIMPLIVPGFDDVKTAQTVELTRIMLLSPIILGVAAVCGGVLISLKRFMAYALAPIFYNIGIIFGAVVLVDYFGLAGLAWGVVLGAILHLAVVGPAAIVCGLGSRTSVAPPWRDPNVRKIMLLMIPRSFGAAAGQMNLLAVSFFASLAAAGSLTAFSFANNIQSIPLGVIGIPFALAAFPTLSAYFAREETAEFTRVVVKYIRRTLFLVLPLSMLLITLRAQAVRVVLGTGAFGWEDTIVTFQIMGILALSIFAQASIPLLARSFYAMQNTMTPVIVAFVSVMVNIAVVVALLPSLDVYAIAIGFSASSVVNFVLLFVLLEKQLNCAILSRVHTSIVRSLIAVIVASSAVVALAVANGINIENLPVVPFSILGIVWLSVFMIIAKLLKVDNFFVNVPVATVIAGIVVQFTKFVIGTVTDLSTFWEVFAQLAIAGSMGVVTYLYVSWLLHIDEFFVLRAKVISYIIRRSSGYGVK